MKNELINRYEIFLVDIHGIIDDGHKVIQSAVDFINQITHNNDKRVVFISNAPRLAPDTRKSLISKGVTGDFDVMTSGEATRYYFQEFMPDLKVYHFGSARNEDILKDFPQTVVNAPDEADIILLTAYLEENEDIDCIQEEIRAVLKSGKPILCANPDTYASFKMTRRKVSGYIAQHLKDLGAEVRYIGKPDPFIYELTFKHLNINHGLKHKAVMIGDTLENDIAGANAFGIDSVLVLTGNTAWQVSHQPEVVKDHVVNVLQDEKMLPTHIVSSL